MTQPDPFVEKFRGSFVSMMRWPQLDSLWETLKQNSGAGWYAYAIGESPPEAPLTTEQMNTFLVDSK